MKADREEKLYRVSVIVPVYNVEKYLSKCIESILAQSYTKLEILLVDDGSTDGSLAVCRKYERMDSRIVVLTQKNQGVSQARNHGLKAASGDVIGFVDGDDYIAPDMISDLMQVMVEQNVDAVFCNYALIEEETGICISNEIQHEKKVCGYPEAVLQILQIPGYNTSVWNKLFKRDMIYEANAPIFFENGLTVGEDQLWLLEVLKKGKKVALLPKTEYYWLKRDNSASRKNRVTKQKDDEIRSARKVIAIASSIGKEAEEIARGRLYFIVSNYLKLEKSIYGYCRTRELFRDLRDNRKAWLRAKQIPWNIRWRRVLGEFVLRMS